MNQITSLEKLRVLLPHWIEHNRNHETEFRKWSASAKAEGAGDLAEFLDKAAANMAATDGLLKKAMTQAGEPDHGHAHRHGDDPPPPRPVSHKA